MKTTKKFLPEACFTPENLAMADVQKALEENATIVGIAEFSIMSTQEVQVRLGDSVIGWIPFEEATIYPFTYSTYNPNFILPIQLAALRGKTVCVKVKAIEDGKIILSRKDNMLEAYEHISLQKALPFKVTATRSNAVYGDVGQGIQAKIALPDLCKSRIRSASEICKIGDSLTVSVLNFDEMKRANVSYKDTFAPYDPNNYKNGDVVTGVINAAVDNNFSGFFINITPQVVGILDYQDSYPALHYGDVIECTVRKASEKGLHLRLIGVLRTHS